MGHNISKYFVYKQVAPNGAYKIQPIFFYKKGASKRSYKLGNSLFSTPPINANRVVEITSPKGNHLLNLFAPLGATYL